VPEHAPSAFIKPIPCAAQYRSRLKTHQQPAPPPSSARPDKATAASHRVESRLRLPPHAESRARRTPQRHHLLDTNTHEEHTDCQDNRSNNPASSSRMRDAKVVLRFVNALPKSLRTRGPPPRRADQRPTAAVPASFSAAAAWQNSGNRHSRYSVAQVVLQVLDDWDRW